MYFSLSIAFLLSNIMNSCGICLYTTYLVRKKGEREEEWEEWRLNFMISSIVKFLESFCHLLMSSHNCPQLSIPVDHSWWWCYFCSLVSLMTSLLCSLANQPEWLLWSKQSSWEMKVSFFFRCRKTPKVRKTLERERQTRRQKSLLISFVKQSCYSRCQLMPVVSKMVNAFCHQMKLFSLWWSRRETCLFLLPPLLFLSKPTEKIDFDSCLFFYLFALCLDFCSDSFYSWKRRGEKREERREEITMPGGFDSLLVLLV